MIRKRKPDDAREASQTDSYCNSSWIGIEKAHQNTCSANKPTHSLKDLPKTSKENNNVKNVHIANI
jgi:hypothetical protein